MRLEGMAQALEEQRRQVDISQLDFERTLRLLVERQWLWRENRSLASRLHHAQLKVSASLEDIDYRHPRGLKRAQIEQLRASQWVARASQLPDHRADRIGQNVPGLRLGHQACRDGHRVAITTRRNCSGNCKPPKPMAAC
jgi:hypothetical protein